MIADIVSFEALPTKLWQSGTLKHMDVQMRSGTYDCGLFAITFATTLVHAEHPGKFLFNQDSMRQHLIK